MSEIVQVNQQQVNAVYDLLADIKGGSKKAIITALNQTLGYSVELTQKIIGEATTLDAKIIKANVTGEEARENTLATMKIFKGRIPLAQFRTRPMVINYRLGGNKPGVSVQVWRNKPPVEFRHAFFARMPSGHEGLFERRGKNRLPIDEMKGPSTATIYQNTPGLSAKIEQLSAERLLMNLTDGVDTILGISHG